MAIMVPPSLPTRATVGERRLYNSLQKLPDDCIVYHETMIGSRMPDYIVIMPKLGVLVLEVKDYLRTTIVEGNVNGWKLTGDKLVTFPLQQARNYAFSIQNKLESVPVLRNRVTGRLNIPYGYGVAMTKINRYTADELDLYGGSDRNLWLFSDELDSDLYDYLSDMFTVNFRQNSLSEEEITAIRGLLFPEVMITKYVEGDLLDLDNLVAMDLHQESLARHLGDGHRLLRGVAGSGKTLILLARARLLRKYNDDWRILVLVTSSTVARFISEQLQDDQIEVHTFYDWLRSEYSVQDDTTIAQLLGSDKSKYQAILIDEGQDFTGDWLRLAVDRLDEETGSFLLVEDPVQDIYRKGTSLAKEIGLDFRGRSKVLRINYRNPKEIIKLAWSFHEEFCQEDENELIPYPGNREGGRVIMRNYHDLASELEQVSKMICYFVEEKGYNYDDVAVIYRAKRCRGLQVDKMTLEALAKRRIPFYPVSLSARHKKNYLKIKQNAVSVMNIDDSKGLDFPIVIIIDAGNIPYPAKGQDKTQDAIRMYVAMTRASERLIITHNTDSEFTNWLHRREDVLTRDYTE